MATQAGRDLHYQRKGSHCRVYLNGKVSIFPDHPGKEMATGTVNNIKKDLGLK